MTKPTRTVGRVAAGLIAVLGVFAFAAACGVPLPTAFQDDEPYGAVIPASVDDAAVSLQDLSTEPQFTPYTVAPSFLNRHAVVESM